MRIGGEFEFSPEIFGAATQAPFGPVSPYAIETDTGRSALYIAARAMQKAGCSNVIWLPAFCCVSVTQAFTQAGFQLYYYPTNGLSEPALLPKAAKGDAVLFVHYFGHTNQHMLDAVADYQAAGIWVIEDFVQAGLNGAMQLKGDFGVSSYRKLLPVPDGAKLMTKTAIDLEAIGVTLQAADEAFISAKLAGKVLRGQGAAAAEFLPLLESAEQQLDSKVQPRQISYISGWMLARLDTAMIASQRRDNWQLLAEKLTAPEINAHVKPLMPKLAMQEVPLGLPVFVAAGKRDQLKRYVAQREIYCPVHWPLDFLPDSSDFEQDKQLAANTLTLPIDQRMTASHVQRMTDSIISFFRETS